MQTQVDLTSRPHGDFERACIIELAAFPQDLDQKVLLETVSNRAEGCSTVWLGPRLTSVVPYTPSFGYRSEPPGMAYRKSNAEVSKTLLSGRIATVMARLLPDLLREGFGYLLFLFRRHGGDHDGVMAVRTSRPMQTPSPQCDQLGELRARLQCFRLTLSPLSPCTRNSEPQCIYPKWLADSPPCLPSSTLRYRHLVVR